MKKEIIEYSFSLSKKVRIYNDELKGVIKESFKDILPIEIIERDKKGFSIPLHNWTSILDDKNLIQEKIINDFFTKNSLKETG